MNLEMVSDSREHSLEASVNFSSRLTIRNPVKTPPVLEVSSWSLEELQIPDEPGDGVR